MTMRPVPARMPWFIIRARLALVPGLSEAYQERISRTRAEAPREAAAGLDSATAAFGFMGRIIGWAQRSGKLQRGVAGGAQDRGAVVHHHPHRHPLEQLPERLLGEEGLAERRALECGKNPGRDTASQVDAREREAPQGDVCRLRSVDADHEIERTDARGARARERVPRDR